MLCYRAELKFHKKTIVYLELLGFPPLLFLCYSVILVRCVRLPFQTLLALFITIV